MILSKRTFKLLMFDLKKFLTFITSKLRASNIGNNIKLHLGCGKNLVKGWLNCDIQGSDFDVDITRKLPWKNSTFETIVAQQVIEHLELYNETIPFLGESFRLLKSGGILIVSCPDLQKVCGFYSGNNSASMIQDRISRWPTFSLNGAPDSQIVNEIFHQGGEHKNLYDFDLLRWGLEKAGYSDISRITEEDFLHKFPEFPKRNDEFISLYVMAKKQ